MFSLMIAALLGSASAAVNVNPAGCPAERPSTGRRRQGAELLPLAELIPVQIPVFLPACPDGLTCFYGTESCCGETFSSLRAVCHGGRWDSIYTEACMNALCAPEPTPEPEPVPDDMCTILNGERVPIGWTGHIGRGQGSFFLTTKCECVNVAPFFNPPEAELQCGEATLNAVDQGCTLTGGEAVAIGWAGTDTGDNTCNNCECVGGHQLLCTTNSCEVPSRRTCRRCRRLARSRNSRSRSLFNSLCRGVNLDAC